jgi:multidrug efflux pump subunit AcrA (membrane-fusion protein)
MKKMSKKLKVSLFLLLALLLAGGGFFCYKKFYVKDTKKEAKDNAAPDRIYPVKRGQMVIGIVLRGSVNAKVKHKLALQAPFSTKLVKVVDENVKVKKGETLSENHAEQMLKDYRAEIANATKQAEFIQNKKDTLYNEYLQSVADSKEMTNAEN